MHDSRSKVTKRLPIQQGKEEECTEEGDTFTDFMLLPRCWQCTASPLAVLCLHGGRCLPTPLAEMKVMYVSRLLSYCKCSEKGRVNFTFTFLPFCSPGIQRGMDLTKSRAALSEWGSKLLVIIASVICPSS